MTLPAKSKRRLPRFSLLTLIVAVNVAGLLLWANVTDGERHDEVFISHYGKISRTTIGQGWPFPVRLTRELVFIDRTKMSEGDIHLYEEPWIEWTLGGLIKNIALGLTIILIAASLTEFLVRKFRKAKRNDG